MQSCGEKEAYLKSHMLAHFQQSRVNNASHNGEFKDSVNHSLRFSSPVLYDFIRLKQHFHHLAHSRLFLTVCVSLIVLLFNVCTQ